jgi:hypothetical protein
MLSQGKTSKELLRGQEDLTILLRAETTPGRIALFDPNYAVATSALLFVQSGSKAGLGLNNYSGWAVCNGNNGTTNYLVAFAPLIPMMRLS